MGINFSIPIGDVLTSCCSCMAGPVQCMCELQGNLDDLKMALAKLSELKNDVKGKAEIIQRQQKDEIQEWVSKAVAMETLANELIDDGTREIKKRCLCGCCPRNCSGCYLRNYKSSKKLVEDMVKKKDDVDSLYEEGQRVKATADRLTSFELQGNLDDLKMALAKLSDLKNDVMGKAEIIQRQQMKQSLDEILEWVSKAVAMETLANELIDDGTREIEKGSLRNCKSSKKLVEDMVKKKDDMDSLYGEGRRVKATADRLTSFKLQGNLDDLKMALAKLSDLKNDVMGKAEIIQRQQMKQLDEILEWVSKAVAMETLANELIDDGTRDIEKGSLRNYKSSYKLVEDMVKKKDDVDSLYEEGQRVKATADNRLTSFELQGNLDDLKMALAKLSDLKNDVMGKAEIIQRQQMKQLEEILEWVSKAVAREIEKGSLMNCKSSYKLVKDMVKKKGDVDSLYEEGQCVKATVDRLTSFAVDERPIEPTMGLESTFMEVWGYIEGKQVGIIGLCGMGGIGKTAILNKINKELCNSTHDFNPVIWVTVSKNPDPLKVQIEIGSKIGFHDDLWKTKSQIEKAIDIYNVLKKGKFVLLLDDIWQRFELSEVGVPLPNNQNGSKVVFTTRSEVVCGHMGAKLIKVKLLEPEPALALFKRKVTEDTINAHQEIPKLAEIVAAVCRGLPLALITIGGTMACKRTPQQWHRAIEALKKYPTKFPGMGEDVFPPLKFSYDSLPSDDRSCFLYFSLFPEDYLISKDTLVEYWINW